MNLKCAFPLLLAAFLGHIANSAIAEETVALPEEIMIEGETFIHIPAGWFWFSVTDTVHNEKLVKVWLDDYYIAKYEARAADWAEFLQAQTKTQSPVLVNKYSYAELADCTVDITPGPTPEDHRTYKVKPGKENHPASAMSWLGARDFAAWKGFRLLTDAEWQKAARGSEDKRKWPWGDEYPDSTRAVFGINSCDHVKPVDALPDGRSPYGVYNMAGNAREFVSNWWSRDYDEEIMNAESLRNPQGPVWPAPHLGASNFKYLKGGRFAASPEGISIAAKALMRYDDPFICNGVRFALDADSVREHVKNSRLQGE